MKPKGIHSFQASESAVSPVIGVILMVAITVAMAAIVMVLVSGITDNDAEAPNIVFSKSSDSLTVQRADLGLDWDDFSVQGCTAPTGNVTAGDKLTSCTGQVTVTYVPGNVLLYDGVFQ